MSWGVNLATCDNRKGTRKEGEWPTRKEKAGKERAPWGFQGACGGNLVGQLPARALRSNRRVNNRQRARYPITRNRGFISELLNDHSAVEFDHLGMIAEPLKGLGFAVGIVPADFIETVGFGGLKRGGILGPFAANPDGIEF